MKALIVLVAVLAVVSARDFRGEFARFKANFGKKYESAVMEERRYNNFVHNMLVAAALQAQNPLATFGANAFADLSPDEFKRYHNAELYFKNRANGTLFTGPLAAPGPKIDWREKGAVTYVKNQGQCGSCWSFSATGNIEGQWKLAGHELVAVSEQELVSCDTIDDGCNGGLMDNAFTYIVTKRGGEIATEASYPYVSGDGVAPRCEMNKNRKVGAKIKGHHDIPKKEVDIAAYLFEHGPVSIAVDATSWQTYQGGIMTNCISQQIDHGVLAVGYDDEHKPPYWIIKNSWGASWGEKGYIRVEKGRNECLIDSDPSSSIAA